MNPRLFLLPVVALCLMGFAKKQPQVIVRFHTEANERDTEQFASLVSLQNPPRKVFIQKIPILNEHDIVGVYPFAAPDNTMGCAFKFDAHGTLELDTESITRHGSDIFGFINNRMVCDLLIDKRVSDGVLVIPSGLTKDEIAALQKRFHTLGNPKSKNQ